MTIAEELYGEELHAFLLEDLTSEGLHLPILFYGSSSIRLWDSLSMDFPHKILLNRGFGGSKLVDCLEFADRLVVPYSPSAIIFYAGDNDLDQGASPQEVATLYKKFIRLIRRDVGRVPVTFMSIKPSPARFWNLKNIVEANRLVEEFTQQESGLYFIDTVPSMLDEAGNPQMDLYVDDGLHLNAKGYASWASMLLRRNEIWGSQVQQTENR